MALDLSRSVMRQPFRQCPSLLNQIEDSSAPNTQKWYFAPDYESIQDLKMVREEELMGGAKVKWLSPRGFREPMGKANLLVGEAT